MNDKVNAMCVYDFTDNNYNDLSCIKIYLRKYCKKWCFVGEQVSRKHWQGRISLKVKKRLVDIPNPLKLHFSITSNACKNNNFYIEKGTSAITEIYKDDEDIIETKQLLIFNSFTQRPWQAKILGMSQVFDMRSIDIVYDQIGNIGKSLFGEHMESLGLAEEIPPFRLMDDIFQWVYGRPKRKAYFVDMPRGMKKDKLGDFYSGIEIIKNGVAYDKRYTAKKIRFDRPRIFIFTNSLPNFELMSRDRWCVWKISPNYDLVPVDTKSL